MVFVFPAIPTSVVLQGLFLLIIGASFFATVVLTRYWVRAARRIGLIGRNMHDFRHRPVPESGGVAVVSAMTFAILVYVFVKTFVLSAEANLEVFGLLVTILLAGYIGFIDDIMGWKIGIGQARKLLLTVPIAFPLVAMNAGLGRIDLPMFGVVDFGLLYPLLLVPIAIIFTTNVFNMLAGWNGLEAGMGAIVIATLGILAAIRGQLWLATVAFAIVFALIGFLIYNRYPAKIFPGDSLTYAIGAAFGAITILGHFEKRALILLAPYFAEFAIKAAHRFKTECFAIPQRDGSLLAPKRIGSLTHIVLRGIKRVKNKVYEPDVVYTFLLVEVLLAAVVLVF